MDRVRPVALIGEGRQGQVFVGLDPLLRRCIVVKRISSGSFANAERRERLIQEACVFSRLDAALAHGLDFAKKVQVATAVASALTDARRNDRIHAC